jgi:ArsR family transcriptional regulator
MRKVKSTLFHNLESVTVVLRALSNSSRLRITLALLSAELSVATLEETLEIKQPNLSQQLAELRKAGILEARRSAKSVFYSIGDSKVRDVIALIAGNIDNLDGITLSQAAIETRAETLSAAAEARIKALSAPDAGTEERAPRPILMVETTNSNARNAQTWQGEEAQFARVWPTTNR